MYIMGKNQIILYRLLESYRGLGIGKKIMNKAIKNAVEKKKTVSLQVA